MSDTECLDCKKFRDIIKPQVGRKWNGSVYAGICPMCQLKMKLKQMEMFSTNK